MGPVGRGCQSRGCRINPGRKQYLGFSFEVYPDPEACQKVHRELAKINWFCWMEVDSLLGTPIKEGNGLASALNWASQLALLAGWFIKGRTDE